jgi:DNA-binding HxlR family transcriptional regulator
MRHTSLNEMSCPIARSLDRVGEWWSILILRDALRGVTRFDDFRRSLGVAPNMLTRRLTALVDAGLLERRRYSEHPPRDEYVPTERGRDFRPVLLALLAWGNRHFAPEGPSVEIVHAATGAVADPVLVDRHTGLPVDGPDYRTVYRRPAAGPPETAGAKPAHRATAANAAPPAKATHAETRAKTARGTPSAKPAHPAT